MFPSIFSPILEGFGKRYDLPVNSEKHYCSPPQALSLLPHLIPGDALARGPGSGGAAASRGSGAVLLSLVVPPLPNHSANLSGPPGLGVPLSAQRDHVTTEGRVAENASLSPRGNFLIFFQGLLAGRRSKAPLAENRGPARPGAASASAAVCHARRGRGEGEREGRGGPRRTGRGLAVSWGGS